MIITSVPPAQSKASSQPDVIHNQLIPVPIRITPGIPAAPKPGRSTISMNSNKIPNPMRKKGIHVIINRIGRGKDGIVFPFHLFAFHVILEM
jgi:hypothetical protein